ncbi:MAG: hypothetical protein AABW83_00995 [Nanoarchaeota archaeon]
MANKYEEAVERRKSKAVIESLLKRDADEGKQREQIERAYFGGEYNNIQPEDRSQMAAVMSQDPKVGIPVLKRNLEAMNKEASEGKDLEAIISDAPLEVLASSLQYIPPSSKGEVSDYHSFLYLGYQMAVTQDEVKKGNKNPNELKELEREIKLLALRKYKEEYKDSPDSTKSFIEFFADSIANSNSKISSEFSLGKFQKYLKESQEYLNENDNKVRDYLKTTEDKYKPKLYDVLTSLGQKEEE